MCVRVCLVVDGFVGLVIGRFVFLVLVIFVVFYRGLRGLLDLII